MLGTIIKILPKFLKFVKRYSIFFLINRALTEELLAHYFPLILDNIQKH